MRIGISPPLDGWRDETHRQDWLEAVAAAGIDHVFVADHVTFRGGSGMDGLIRAASFLGGSSEIGAMVGVYLLALRHPIAVARQIATICQESPGRLILGVGVGGEDRHEFEVLDVDPATRGRRTDEALGILRRLLRGETVSHRGEFFGFEEVAVLPQPTPAVPILVGGRSDAALRRAATHGDGWLAAWVGIERFRRGVERVAELAGRSDRWTHGYQNWVGIGASRDEASRRLAPAMERFYRVGFDRFAPLTPHGTVEDVAAELAGLVGAGASILNLTPVAGDDLAAVDAVARIKALVS